jgi:hypothetical protein
MKRVVALAVAVLFGFTVTAHAQERLQPPDTTEAVTAVKPVSVSASAFSKASIDKVAVRAARTMVPKTPQTKKPFFKTPWPYVIIAAVVVVAAVAVGRGSGDGSGIY